MSTSDKVILIGISLTSLGLALYGMMGVMNSFGQKSSLGPLLGSIAAAATGLAVNRAMGPGRALKVR